MLKRMNYLLLAATYTFCGIAVADEQRTHRVIENPVQDGNMIFRINDGGVKKDPITINGATGKATVTQTFQMVWAKVECDATPVITWQGPVTWLDSVTYQSSAGTCDIEITNGFFSTVNTVSCICSDGDLSGSRHDCRVQRLADGDHTFRFDTFTAGTPSDSTGNIICMGFTP